MRKICKYDAYFLWVSNLYSLSVRLMYSDIIYPQTLQKYCRLVIAGLRDSNYSNIVFIYLRFSSIVYICSSYFLFFVSESLCFLLSRCIPAGYYGLAVVWLRVLTKMKRWNSSLLMRKSSSSCEQMMFCRHILHLTKSWLIYMDYCLISILM